MQGVTFMAMRLVLITLFLLGNMAGANSSQAQTVAEKNRAAAEKRKAEVRKRLEARREEFRLSQLEGSRKTNDAFYQRLLPERLMPYFEDPSRGRSDAVFYKFVVAYVRGSRYDPFGQETIATLKELAMAAGSSDDSAAVEQFRTLLGWHLPNYTILEEAMPLVRDNPALGDIELLEWMHKQVTDRHQKLSGNSMERAASIFSINEADFILSTQATRVNDSEVYLDVAGNCYHIHAVDHRHPNGPEKIHIFYNFLQTYVQDNYEVDTPYCDHPFVAPDASKKR